MKRSRDQDAGGEAVGHDLDASLARERGDLAATVKPPQRAMSGWSTSTWPCSTSAPERADRGVRLAGRDPHVVASESRR